MPTISVIMPAYNVEQYLAASVESVLAQTYRDWELVIVDDGSTDRTGRFADEYAARDPRIRVVHQRNGGLSAARNTAMRYARGEFFALLDSDDLWDPDFLTAQMATFASRQHADVVTGNARNLGGPWHGTPARPWPDKRPQPLLADILRDEEAVFIMSVFHRSVYQTVGDFDERLRSNEDYDYWLRAAASGFRFVRNDRPLGDYRRRDDSLSASDVRMLGGLLTVYRKLRPALADRPDELAILDAQVARFETELLAAEARAAIDAGNRRAAADRLRALQSRRPTLAIAIAAVVARCAPPLLPVLYRWNRARLARRKAARAVA
ncbi:MAG TPA: glycosyltransferase family A protein [Vicinamibacterales bacterium]|nr:glycosyltransferase family A protein [Vicinamibacterales bacterium]